MSQTSPRRAAKSRQQRGIVPVRAFGKGDRIGLREPARGDPRGRGVGAALRGAMKQAPRDRPSARGLRVAIVRSLFNRPVTDGLLAGARQAFAEMGGDERRLRVYDLPGAFELPLAAQAAARSGRFDAVVALGAVIEGDTDHYEHVARETASGLAAVARETGVPGGVRRAHGAAGEAGPATGGGGPRQQGRGGGAGGGDDGARPAGDPEERRRGRRSARRPPAAGRSERSAHLARPAGSGPADGATDEGEGVRLPAPLPVGDHGRSHGAGDGRLLAAALGHAADARHGRAAGLRGAVPRGRARRRRSPRRRRTGASTGSRRWTGRSCAWGPTSSWRKPQTPAAVILDEAVELAKRFGEADSPSFVNGVLDAIRRRVRDGQG